MLDVLVVAPHPDDAELGMAGAIMKFKDDGWRVGVLDLTNGEPTPLGTPEIRARETAAATAAHGIGLAGEPGPAQSQSLEATLDARAKLAGVFRLQRPRWIFAPYWVDAHPDHVAATELIEAARFWSKLTKTDMPGEPFHPQRIFYYYCVHLRLIPQPAFILDISRYWPRKREALECYHSQLVARPLLGGADVYRPHSRPGRDVGMVHRRRIRRGLCQPRAGRPDDAYGADVNRGNCVRGFAGKLVDAVNYRVPSIKTMGNRTRNHSISRRAMLTQCGAAGVGALAAAPLRAAPAATADKPRIALSLNTATIRGQKLSLPEEVEIAAKAGYQAIEPWVEEIERYVSAGGKPADLKKRIADLGLKVPSAIGFADWINDDDGRRAAGLEQWKRDAELVASIGGVRMAAPPKGAYNVELDLRRVADRYRKLLELSVPLGIVPELEMWGGSMTLSRMSQIAYVLVETGHPQACGLLDVFHIFKGGSNFAGIRVFNGDALHVLHMNDYPAGMSRERATDADRVYPGNGCAPLAGLRPRSACHSLPRLSFAGALQPRLLETRRADHRPRRMQEDARFGEKGYWTNLDRSSFPRRQTAQWPGKTVAVCRGLSRSCGHISCLLHRPANSRPWCSLLTCDISR